MYVNVSTKYRNIMCITRKHCLNAKLICAVIHKSKIDQTIISAPSVQQTSTSKRQYTCLRSFLQPQCIFGVFSICSSKCIPPYHYWSVRRQGLWSWQPGLPDLGLDQQPVWGRMDLYEGWFCCRSPPLYILLSHTGLSYREPNFGGSQGMSHCFFAITEVMRL